jgi:dephospho-CoA kinase
MVARWGDDIVAADGGLDRQTVADRVFGDADELAALNAIVHPAVADEMTRRREALDGTNVTLILDIPLLVESGHEGLGGIIVVDVDPEVAVQRLVAYRGFTEDDARVRIARQASREDRRAKADMVVDNSGSLDELEAQVDRVQSWIDTLDRPSSDQPVTRIGSRSER